MRPNVRLSVLLFAFCLCLSTAQIAMAQPPPIQPGQAIISELRLRGPGGPEDEFIEIYNNTNNPIIVQALDGTNGWSVVVSNGQITGPVCIIPNATNIPARGHFLCTNTNGYSLAGYPSGSPSNQINALKANAIVAVSPFLLTTGDRTWDFDVPDGTGVALFATTNGTNFKAETRLDAFGFTTSPALYREGNGFAIIPNANTEHTIYRDQRPSLTPKDTNNNAADFLFVQEVPSIQTDLLGAPGPENLNSPTLMNTLGQTLLDPLLPASSFPNREKRTAIEANADLGTLYFRRTFTNNTGLPIKRLRFRVYDLTTRGTCPAPCADLRLLTSADEPITVQGTPVPVQGVTLEAFPPSQVAGGGFNASVSDNDITFGTPLNPTQSVRIQFKFGIMRNGNFRLGLNIEGQTSQQVINN